MYSSYCIVWLGPCLSPRLKSYFEPKHSSTIGLHTHHHHTNSLTSSKVESHHSTGTEMYLNENISPSTTTPIPEFHPQLPAKKD